MGRIDAEAIRAAERIRAAKSVVVATHIDADGICAAAIASRALDRLGTKHEVRFLKKLDDAAMAELRKASGLVWFTDLGSGQLHAMQGMDVVISDHHVPSAVGEPTKAQRRDLMALADALENGGTACDVPHVNPHIDGLDGGRQMSGAGAAYMVAKALDPKNVELSALAVVGAVGDLQDRDDGKLIGLNRKILEDAMGAKLVSCAEDISFFGRESRPVHKMLQFQSDPKLPGLTNDEEGCIKFMIDSRVRLRDGENWRRWVDLNRGERMRVIQRLEGMLAKEGIRHRITAEVYLLEKEQIGTSLHDAKEFATLMNSCGRYEKGDVALKVAKGDRNEALDEALGLQQGHRRNLMDCLNIVRDVGIVGMDGLQYFDAGDKIMDSVVGTVAGMALNSDIATRELPIFGIAIADDGVKVSARGTKDLVARGLDLSFVMRTASEQVGGHGGGHNIAAGATIPPGKEAEFLNIASKLVRRQLENGR